MKFRLPTLSNCVYRSRSKTSQGCLAAHCLACPNAVSMDAKNVPSQTSGVRVSQICAALGAIEIILFRPRSPLHGRDTYLGGKMSNIPMKFTAVGDNKKLN